MFRFLAGTGVVFLLTQSLSAATFTVNSFADVVDILPGDGTCITVLELCTLRAAIQEANVLPGGPHTVQLAAGTYVLSIPGGFEDASLSGDLDITQSMTIKGAGAASTIIDGDDRDRVFHIGPLGSAVSVILEDLTIQFGLVVEDSGGGILNESTLEMIRVSVVDNFADGGGSGGGITNFGNLTVRDSLIAANLADGNGGGIDNHGKLTVENTTIEGNSSSSFFFGGGGISNEDVITLINSAVVNNSAFDRGGGIYNCGTATLTNVTVSGNTTTGEGGGIFEGCFDTLTLTNVTITANDANPEGGGGGIFIPDVGGGSAEAKNTIVAGNFGGDCVGSAYTSNGNNISGDDSCPFTASGDLRNIDPLLSPLDDNGGPTLTHSLLTESPAIDAGDNASCPSTDQRGVSRPLDGDGDAVATCDIGAFELSSVEPVISGDLNGDGKIDAADLVVLALEISDGDGAFASAAGGGSYPGTSALDINGDGEIDLEDVRALAELIFASSP